MRLRLGNWAGFCTYGGGPLDVAYSACFLTGSLAGVCSLNSPSYHNRTLLHWGHVVCPVLGSPSAKDAARAPPPFATSNIISYNAFMG